MWQCDNNINQNEYLMHRSHKYIDRKKINNKWRYYYKKATNTLNDANGAVNKGTESVSSSINSWLDKNVKEVTTKKSTPDRDGWREVIEITKDRHGKIIGTTTYKEMSTSSAIETGHKLLDELLAKIGVRDVKTMKRDIRHK